MKKYWADKWVAALRSGTYQQGRGKLHTQKGGYCVLGVLCHLIGEIPTPGYDHSILGTVYLYGPEVEDVVLPQRYVELTGMQSTRGYLTDKNLGVLSLAAMNDGGHNFHQIAGFIETNWESL